MLSELIKMRIERDFLRPDEALVDGPAFMHGMIAFSFRTVTGDIEYALDIFLDF